MVAIILSIVFIWLCFEMLDKSDDKNDGIE